MSNANQTDLVLEGGGVKGIAHIGAITTLEAHGYGFHRVAGTSAGAIAAAVVAGCVKKGRRVADVQDLMWPGKTGQSIEYRRVPGGDLGIPGVEGLREAVSLVTHEGLYDTMYLRDWIHTTLKREFDVEYFGDIRLPDPDGDLTEQQQYGLVVMATDISRGALVRLPWDYHVYGLDADDQLVADAVVASASIPFFFTPARLRWRAPSQNVSYLADGGACSDFPIEIFDRLDDEEPRWPTFGVKLSARPAQGALLNRVSGVVSYTMALLETVINGNDQVHLADPSVQARTIFVDTSKVTAADFDLDDTEIALLYGNGVRAAEEFLQGWNWDSYLDTRVRDSSHAERTEAARGRIAVRDDPTPRNRPMIPLPTPPG